MRWDSLFEDLEGQLEQELDAEELELRAEEERLRIGRMTLRDRIVAAAGPGSSDPVRLRLADGSPLRLRLSAYGRDWLAGEAGGELNRRGPVVVPIGAIGAVTLDPGGVQQSLESGPAVTPPPLADRLGLAFVLRSVCRRRSPVEVVVADGVLAGTIDRVGRDHLDLAMHEAGSLRRRDAVTELRIVPFAQLLLMRI